MTCDGRIDASVVYETTWDGRRSDQRWLQVRRCGYAIDGTRMSVKHQPDVRKRRLVPFEAINAPECSGDCSLIPVPTSLVDQTRVPEFGFQLSL